ncbi:MAG: HAD family hydrolase [Planctomycetota bacterium]|jgi:putative hydrolase of the HAD superfamily
MRYDAVFFDLWGTLVPGLQGDDYMNSVRATADALGAEPNAFAELWAGPEVQKLRDSGRFASKREALQWTCERLGLSTSEAQLQHAADIRYDYTKRGLIPRADAVDTLTQLRQRGLKLGMMSACSADTATIWPTLSLAGLFDVALLSCEAGLTKPDPRFYAMAFEQLGVEASRCLYVGDGAGDELGGAQRVGAHPVLINAPDEEHPELASPFDGPRISQLGEVLQIIEDAT